jgi:hypothetical protein
MKVSRMADHATPTAASALVPPPEASVSQPVARVPRPPHYEVDQGAGASTRKPVAYIPVAAELDEPPPAATMPTAHEAAMVLTFLRASPKSPSSDLCTTNGSSPEDHGDFWGRGYVAGLSHFWGWAPSSAPATETPPAKTSSHAATSTAGADFGHHYGSARARELISSGSNSALALSIALQ